MPSTNLDGLRFALHSSTASVVNVDAPTTFDYHQDGSLVWGEYTGDTVIEGRFVGSVDENVLAISFAHSLVRDGSVVRGDSQSDIVTTDDGELKLVESFRIDDVEHTSICIQL